MEVLSIISLVDGLGDKLWSWGVHGIGSIHQVDEMCKMWDKVIQELRVVQYLHFNILKLYTSCYLVQTSV